MSTGSHFWVKIGHKLQPWAKFQTFRQLTPPPSSFRSIPTLYYCIYYWLISFSWFSWLYNLIIYQYVQVSFVVDFIFAHETLCVARHMLWRDITLWYSAKTSQIDCKPLKSFSWNLACNHDYFKYTPWVKKRRHYTLVHIFANYWLIFSRPY